MASQRRIGTEVSETRALLLDHAETLMREQGYAAVTSRQLAKVAGLSPQIVYYYFRTMDDLFDALFGRVADFYLKEIERVAASPAPLLGLWELSSDPSRAVIVSEFIALSNHRKRLQASITEFGRAYHGRRARLIAEQLTAGGVDLAQWPPGILATIMENLARGFSFSTSYEIGDDREARQFVADRLAAIVRGG